jgi:hypothetical protein
VSTQIPDTFTRGSDNRRTQIGRRLAALAGKIAPG